jgi:nitrogen fixation protein NifB
VTQAAPDIKLCLSTNGLMLPEYVDRIQALNIDHVTITINMIDPEIGAKIYPWIYYNRKKY